MDNKQLLIERAARTIAESSEGSPIISTMLVMLFYVMFAVLEVSVERLIWGERFEHWLDPVFILAFIGFASYCVAACAKYNADKLEEKVKSVLRAAAQSQERG